MKRFAQLYAELDATTSTAAKVEALERYLAQAPAADAAWAVYFLSGGKPRQVVRTSVLRALACELAALPEWLFEASYQAVGDLAETIAHVLPPGSAEDDAPLAEWVQERLQPLRGMAEPELQAQVRAQWAGLDSLGRMLWVKLAGGGFRVGVSRLLVQRALAAHAQLEPSVMAQRMMGYTDGKTPPTASAYAALVAPQGSAAAPGGDGRPYPFFLAHALTVHPQDGNMGTVAEWLLEWKFDGIRAQVVKRASQVWLWSRGEELVSEAFPELQALAQRLPQGTVLDGEILAWLGASPDPSEPGLGLEAWGGRHAQEAGLQSEEGPARSGPAPFALLQQRLGRKRLTAQLLQSAPAVFVAYDLLEEAGQDLRQRPQSERRERLQAVLAAGPFAVSPRVQEATWPAVAARREAARELGVEGLMLKRLDSAYGVGRTRTQGLWLKWKTEPMVVDGVLVYAQAGHGRRASLYTDYTFAVWNRSPTGEQEAQTVIDAIAAGHPLPAQAGVPLAEQPLQLVAFAKAYSGLSDAQFKEVDAVIRRSTLQKFGPVRSVRPSMVFELAFEGIQESRRHKSGVALRFPRMTRLRTDKPLHEANTLADLQALIAQGKL